MSVPAVFNIKQGDRLPGLTVQLLDSTGQPLNVAGKTVAFRMRPATGGALKVTSGSCTIVDGARGLVRYPWAAADTDTLGDFDAEFIVTDAGLVQTIPSSGYVTVRVGPVLT